MPEVGEVSASAKRTAGVQRCGGGAGGVPNQVALEVLLHADSLGLDTVGSKLRTLA